MQFIRSANTLAVLAILMCLLAQVSMAMPQLMRPKLRVLGVVTDDDAATDVAGVETQSFDEVVADPSSTVVDEPVATPLVAAASASPATESNATPETSTTSDSHGPPVSNSAGLASPQLGLGAVFVIGSLGAVIQLL